MAKNIYRQGDVLLVQVSGLPEGAEVVTGPRNQNGKTVLAFGEVTGHHHRIESNLATMYQWEGDTLIEVKPEAVLVHEEHAAIPVAPGTYKVTIQREYVAGEIRNVAD
jgi:hypothetical protein